MEFSQTQRGVKFFECDFPRAVKALESIAKSMGTAESNTPKQEPINPKISPKNPLIKPCKEEIIALLNKDSDDDSIGALTEVIDHEIATDDENPYRAAKYMLKAYLDDDIDSFCIALCGWSMRSLLAKAKLIEDVEGVVSDD